MNPKTLHVLSYNIHKGFSTTRLRFSLDRIKQSLQRVHADLVFLQEVLGHHKAHGPRMPHWPTTSQFEYLADQVWPHVAYGKNAIYAAGHHGNAILSKYPILAMDNLDVSNSRLERRGLLHACIALPGQDGPLHAICLHLDLRESGRHTQVERLCRRIMDTVPQDAPLVVAGDFNDWQGRVSRVLEKHIGLQEVFMNIHGAHARTFPSWCPVLRMDRIYVRGLKISSARTLNKGPLSRLSDHVAIFSELVI
ncbi:MAG: endonuclease/exonuclease/phosphatase family protein [Fibrobacterota bacterium]